MLHGLLVGDISLTVRHPRIFEGHLTSSPASFQNRSALRIHEVSNSRLATSRFLRPYGNTGDPVNKRWKRMRRKKIAPRFHRPTQHPCPRIKAHANSCSAHLWFWARRQSRSCLNQRRPRLPARMRAFIPFDAQSRRPCPHALSGHWSL